jgi:LPS-assembly protein
MVKYLRTYALFLQSLFILPLAQAQENQWDWAPKESLTTEQQAQLGQYCKGAYINGWQATSTQNTNLTADLIVRDRNGVIHLEGAAEIIQPKSTLSADQIEGIPNEYYQASGNVVLRSENQLIRSSNSYISDNGKATTEFTDARFLSHDTGARVEAQSLRHDQNGVVFIEEGFFTTCEPTDESWKLYGSSIELDPNSGFGTAKHVQIRIAGLPIFYFPWLRFPIDEKRHTGFLFPSFSYSGSDGLSVSAPVYWNIAPNVDATITPNYIQKEGEGIDLEIRHLSPYGTTSYEQSTFESDEEGEQTLIKFTSDQKFNQYFSTGVTLEDNPTEDLYPEANTTSIGEKDNYERSAYIRLNNGNFFNEITYLTYQTPDTSEDKPFEWRPRIDSSYRAASNNINYNLDLQYTDFYDPDEDDFDGERFVIDQDISLDFAPAWGGLSVGILSQSRSYNLHDYTSDSDETTTISNLTSYFDSSLVFEGNLTDSEGMWRQTITPRLSYLNSPYVDQDDIEDFDAIDPTLTYSRAFSHKRFEGNDRIGDTEQIAFGLESRLYDENNNEKWAFKAGQLFYLKDRYVDIDGDTDEDTAIDDSERSDLLTSINYNGNRYSLTSYVNYSLDDDNINLVQFIAQLEPAENVKLNLSYLYSINNTDTDDDAKEASFGTIFPINQNWSMYTQYTYDFLDDEATKQVTGLGYENCCMKVSLSYQDWLDDDDEFDRGVFLQFTLRSLSTVGNSNSESSIAETYWNQGKVGY